MRQVMLLAGTALAITLAVSTAPRPRAQSFNAAAGTVPAPDPNIPLYFEAASVKPSDPSNPPGQGIRRQPGGRFNTFNAPVRTLVTFAYQIQNYQLGVRDRVQAEVPPGQLPPGAPPPPVDPDAPNLFTAIQEQLGLKLDATKGPVEVWVVDSVERPTTD